MFQEYFNNFPPFENLFFPFLHDYWPAGLAQNMQTTEFHTFRPKLVGLLSGHYFEGDGVGGTGQPLNDSSEPLESNDDRRR
jgi:hypothetical protein